MSYLIRTELRRELVTPGIWNTKHPVASLVSICGPGKTHTLPNPRGIDPGADDRGGFSTGGAGEIGIRHWRDIDMNVDAIQQRTRDTTMVTLDLLAEQTQARCGSVRKPHGHPCR